MFVLIADSGSTKTDWVVIENSKVLFQAKTIGFNPYFLNKDQIRDEILTTLLAGLKPHLPEIKQTYFYGTGCSTEQNCKLIETAIHESLGLTNISVAHDLLASARALCKNEKGIAAILGTGSNSCLYDGKNILENVPSAGYLWSDYGAGSQIGKFFIRDYFEQRLPKDIAEEFEKAGYTRDNILNGVYKNAVPSKYLATVSMFVGQRLEHPHVIKVLTECFDSFFEQTINKYTASKKYKIHMLGSVAFFYKDFIKVVAGKHGYQIGTVLSSPMEGLIEYHSKY